MLKEQLCEILTVLYIFDEMATMIRVFLALSLLAFVSCSSKKKTEREYYEETISSFKYKTYRTASGTALGPVVETYNNQKPDSIAPLNQEYVRLLMGFMWTLSNKPAMAFAEADLAEESTREDVKFLSMSLRSITMYEQTWDTLAREESQRAKKYASIKPGSEAEYEIAFFYMVMGIAKIYDKDFNQSKLYWAGFANETQIHWPYQLTDAIDDLQNNRLQQALSKLKVMSKDPHVPPALSAVLTEEITKIEEKGGDVNSSLFWPKLISTIIFDELKKTGNEQMISVIELLEKWREKLPS